MRRVSRIGAGALLVGGLGGCASISGLDQFTSRDCVDGCDASLDSGLASDDTGIPGSMDDAMTATDRTIGTDAIDWTDAIGTVDEGTGMSGGRDSGDDGGDARVEGGKVTGDGGDAGAVCGPQTCSSGCCDSRGSCTVTSASTCGSGGVACQNCASGGQICSNGSCSTPDAGRDSGQACTPSTCLNLCVPYFHQCCKADQTCGCSINFPPGPCQ